MKTDIHPTYTDTIVKCSCGNNFTTKSTVEGDLTVELCNECHPFFTGKQKLVDSGGRRALQQAVRPPRRQADQHRRRLIARRYADQDLMTMPPRWGGIVAFSTTVDLDEVLLRRLLTQKAIRKENVKYSGDTGSNIAFQLRLIHREVV